MIATFPPRASFRPRLQQPRAYPAEPGDRAPEAVGRMSQVEMESLATTSLTAARAAPPPPLPALTPRILRLPGVSHKPDVPARSLLSPGFIRAAAIKVRRGRQYRN